MEVALQTLLLVLGCLGALVVSVSGTLAQACFSGILFLTCLYYLLASEKSITEVAAEMLPVPKECRSSVRA